jgi:hypothetical protein
VLPQEGHIRLGLGEFQNFRLASVEAVHGLHSSGSVGVKLLQVFRGLIVAPAL